MKGKKSLSDRMKEYEVAYKYVITPRSYVMVRLDGKNFSKYTKNLEKPFDVDFSDAMNETAQALCDEFNCKFAYTQSDEITLVITEIGNINADPIFGNSLQKLCSLTASVATAKFNEVRNTQYMMDDANCMDEVMLPKKQAFFDSRVFVVPNADEVANNIIFRQQDCTRNSVSMAAHELLGHKVIMNKSGSDKQDMMMEKGVNWNDFPTKFKRGCIIQKEVYEKEVDTPDGLVLAKRSRWKIDLEIPVFTKDREYLINLIPIN